MTSARTLSLHTVVRLFERVGAVCVRMVEEVGAIVLLFWQAILWTFRPPFRVRIFVQALEFVGVGSLFIVLLTGFFAGAVMGLQTGRAFRMFGADTLMGPTTALALARELSPVFTALMVAGRVGSAMATELGTMRVTEQIDAMLTMAVNPVQYLVVPRMLAALIMAPILCMFFNAIGYYGCYLVGTGLLHIDSGMFIEKTKLYLQTSDVLSGIIKAGVFGVSIAVISCYKGFAAEGGARGVGIATTQAVVYSSVVVLILDYFLTILMF